MFLEPGPVQWIECVATNGLGEERETVGIEQNVWRDDIAAVCIDDWRGIWGGFERLFFLRHLRRVCLRGNAEVKSRRRKTVRWKKRRDASILPYRADA